MATKDFSRPFIRLSPDDNILIARVPLSLGQRVDAEGLTVKAQVPAGHKIAATAIAKGEPVRYGREGSLYGLDDYQSIKYLCMGGLAASASPAAKATSPTQRKKGKCSARPSLNPI